MAETSVGQVHRAARARFLLSGTAAPAAVPAANLPRRISAWKAPSGYFREDVHDLVHLGARAQQEEALRGQVTSA
jgi:hypothetical protein